MHRFRMRLILALIASVTLVSVASTYFDVLAHRHVLRTELERRTKWMGMSIVPDVQSAMRTGDPSALSGLMELLQSGTGALGLAVYDPHGHLLASSGPAQVMTSLNPEQIRKTLEKQEEISAFERSHGLQWLEETFPLREGKVVSGSMVILSDARYIHDEGMALWRRSFWRIVALVVLIVAITVGMVSWFLTRPIGRIAERIRNLKTSSGAKPPEPGAGELSVFTTMAREMETMAQNLKAARAAAAAEARLREAGEHWWTAGRLALHMRNHAGSSRIFVVSNREPYMHVRHGRETECVVPPSGLVTALEPVLRACDGVWVAYGSGNADAANVDAFDRLRVPPDEPRYTLRRVWLSEEEEAQYYDGFANEGLWPLCHIAHTRPIFRAGDWECYQRVNERFADALLEEMKEDTEPVVFVQDYHFALLPRLVKRTRPDARVAIFWHIPWPNPEAFGICPWQDELLDGLLGADLIGFHVPQFCHNFLSTVDSVLEARTDHEHLTTQRHGHVTTVKPYPVSVAFSGAMRSISSAEDSGTQQIEVEEQMAAERERLLSEFGVHAECLLLGVDRLDYTKGIVERLTAIEQLLDEKPWYRGRLTMVQIAAPSRTRIPSYAALRSRVEEMAASINERFESPGWKPVVLIERQCNHEEVRRWYCAADLCLVTSLHDGMNLVAKEYVAARDDEDGVLVLSKFTGAAVELREALIVNPYDIGGVAEAIHIGLDMNRAERRRRMRRMRRQVMEHNIYFWAASILGDLRELRLEQPEGVGVKPLASSNGRGKRAAVEPSSEPEQPAMTAQSSGRAARHGSRSLA
jgi:alpha,alpha-trehalose-phosphate synthase [UDP-forming]